MRHGPTRGAARAHTPRPAAGRAAAAAAPALAAILLTLPAPAPAAGQEPRAAAGPRTEAPVNTLTPEEQAAGSNFALHPAPAGVVRPAGEWNAARLVVRGNHVEHWLNGVKVVEYELGSPDWQARVAKSKFAALPLYGRAPEGHIALQDHGDWVAYRNIKIRPPRATVSPAAYAQYTRPGGSVIRMSRRNAIAFRSPSPGDIRLSSCSMLITES